MAKTKEKFTYSADGSIDISAWIDKIKTTYPLNQTDLIAKACQFTQHITRNLLTFYGKPYLEVGLEVVEEILKLKLVDQETAAASLIGSTVSLTSDLEKKLKIELGDSVLKLILGLQQMDIIPSLHIQPNRDKSQSDKIRNMLLAMATDIRVVIIKLAERLCFMRHIKNLPAEQRQVYAQEVVDIYAPLAHRLGIGQIKWELEDLAFHYLEPVQYKSIAAFLAERRIDRETRIASIMNFLQEKLAHLTFNFKLTGRPKHIYSIFLKSKRKELGYKDIYDSNAVRILVPSIQDCYTVLSIVHSLWSPIMEEFDDYIAHPKANGYRSIHTTLLDQDSRHFEIQIRTYAMHEEAERGIAAHWLYKENKTQNIDNTAKISYLHQLIDWHQEVEKTKLATETIDTEIYVITPRGEILNLPQGATPLDFAYFIHSEIGHRCRGAKVNGQIAPLTYTLRTGDRVEILTILQGNPSRDWLNPELGYVKTTRAKNKISHWFKQQAVAQDLEIGKNILERELAKQGLSKSISTIELARHFSLKNEDALFTSLARGNIRLAQLMQIIKPNKTNNDDTPSPFVPPPITKKNYGSAIVGAHDLLTRLSKCCKPIPGDDIVGYITQGRGISIHKKTCTNIDSLIHSERFININWDNQSNDVFNTDLKIIAQDEKHILQDITGLFANEKITLLHLQSNLDKNQNLLFVTATVQIQNIQELQRLITRLEQLPHVISVSRQN